MSPDDTTTISASAASSCKWRALATSSSSLMAEALSLLLRWQGEVKTEAVDSLVRRALELDKVEVPTSCDCPQGP